MDKNLHHIEDLFKSGLDDNEEMPSAKVWDAVDNRLDKDTVVAIKKKYKTWKRLLFLLLLLLIGLSIYELNNRRTNNGVAKVNNDGVGKESVLNNDNGNKKQNDKNSFTSKDQIDSKDVNNNNTAVNTTPDNSIFTTPPSGNNLMINKQNQSNVSTDVNTIANSPVALKQNSLLTNKPGYRNKIKTSTPGSNMQNVTTDNNAVQTNKPMPFPWQLNLLPVEKLNTPAILSPDSKNSLYTLALTKSNPLIDTKNSVNQQAKKKETKPSRFSITGFFSPDIASYHLEEDQPGNQPETARKIEKGERHEFSSTSGLLLDYNLNKHWSLQSGLTFSNTNIKVNPKTIYAQNDNNGNINTG